MKKKTVTLYIVLLIIGITFIFILITERHHLLNNKDDNLNNTLPVLNISNYQDYFAFNGSLIKENLFNNRYLSLLYNDNNQKVGHLIDLKLRKEISLKEVINNYGDFSEKINELQALKYPSAITKILNNNSKTYHFDDEGLMIYYQLPESIESKRDFTLKINYPEIKDYLSFEVTLNNDYVNENGRKYDPNKISISFTFDDGPSEGKTDKLIEALESYNMSATFFMVGYKLEKNASLVKKVNDSHSEVGYHSYNHTRFTTQSVATIQSEFNQSDNIFYSITGNHLKLTRPPYGSFNASVLGAIDNAFIRWNIDTNDWQYKDVDYLVNYVMDNIQDRSIILFHDSYDTSVEAATRLMEKLYFEDIQVLSVSELARLSGIELENHTLYYSFN